MALVFVAGLLGLAWGGRRVNDASGVPFVGFCRLSGRSLHLNREDSDAPAYEELGLGKSADAIAVLSDRSGRRVLFQPWPDVVMLAWLPGILYLFAAVLDRVDGYATRRTGHGSLLGQELDMVSDAMGLAASLLAVGYGQVHPSYLLFGLAYYLFHGGLMWRECRGFQSTRCRRHCIAGRGRVSNGFLVVVLGRCLDRR